MQAAFGRTHFFSSSYNIYSRQSLSSTSTRLGHLICRESALHLCTSTPLLYSHLCSARTSALLAPLFCSHLCSARISTLHALLFCTHLCSARISALLFCSASLPSPLLYSSTLLLCSTLLPAPQLWSTRTSALHQLVSNTMRSSYLPVRRE
jgi:hypothetical protein